MCWRRNCYQYQWNDFGVGRGRQESRISQSRSIQAGGHFVQVDSAVFDAKSTPDDVALKMGGPKATRWGRFATEMAKSELDLISTTESHHHCRQWLSLH